MCNALSASGMEPHAICTPEATISSGPDQLHFCSAGRGAEAAVYLAEHLERHLAARWGIARSAGELLAGALAGADAAFRAQQDAAWAQR